MDTLATRDPLASLTLTKVKVLFPQSPSKEDQRRAHHVKHPTNAAKDCRPMDTIFLRSDQYLVISPQGRASVFSKVSLVIVYRFNCLRNRVLFQEMSVVDCPVVIGVRYRIAKRLSTLRIALRRRPLVCDLSPLKYPPFFGLFRVPLRIPFFLHRVRQGCSETSAAQEGGAVESHQEVASDRSHANDLVTFALRLRVGPRSGFLHPFIMGRLKAFRGATFLCFVTHFFQCERNRPLMSPIAWVNEEMTDCSRFHERSLYQAIFARPVVFAIGWRCAAAIYVGVLPICVIPRSNQGRFILSLWNKVVLYLRANS